MLKLQDHVIADLLVSSVNRGVLSGLEEAIKNPPSDNAKAMELMAQTITLHVLHSLDAIFETNIQLNQETEVPNEQGQ